MYLFYKLWISKLSRLYELLHSKFWMLWTFSTFFEPLRQISVEAAPGLTIYARLHKWQARCKKSALQKCERNSYRKEAPLGSQGGYATPSESTKLALAVCAGRQLLH